MKRWAFRLMALALLLAGGRVEAAIVYSQHSDFGSPTASGFASQNDTTGGFGNFATAYDNFTLTSAAAVNRVTWQGLYFNPPVQGTITGFTLTFWSNNPAGGGQPGVALLTTHISGNAGETFVGNEQGTLPTFNYATMLPTEFDALAGTEYWLSIVPDLGFPPQWAWHTGTGGDSRAITDFLGGRNVITSDLAFSLESGAAAVPEPGSLTLLGAGSLILLGYRRWRRQPA